MKFVRYLPLLVLSAVLLACSLTVNVPTTNTGPTQTITINELPISGAQVNKLNIEMGAGSLSISKGAQNLVEGEIQFNVDDWKPVIRRSEDTLTLSQKNTSNISIPDGNIKNKWTLMLGNMPIDLNLALGAYDGELDLSGLSITNLSISDGASKSIVIFDTPNPVEMSALTYKTGASTVELLGLGNANVQEVSFDGGVGSYRLDFSGNIQKNIDVTINSGMSDVKIEIPANVRARVELNSGLSNIDATGTWTISNTLYECGSTGPLITIRIDMAVGNLQLIQN